VSVRNALLLAMGVVAVSFSAIFIRLAHAPSLTVAFYRNAMAAVVILPLAIVRKPDEFRSLTRGRVGVAVLSGSLLAVHFASWIASLSFTTIAASVVLVTSSAIFVAWFGRIFLGEAIERAAVVGILVGLVGAAIVSGGDFGLSARAAGGDLLALAGAVAAGGYFVAGRHLRQTVSLLTYVGLVYATCAVLLLVAVLATGTQLTGFPAKAWVLFGLMALVPQGLGHTVFNFVLKDVDATAVAVSIMGEPVGATLLALAFFGEAPPWTAVAGGVVLLAGIYVATTRQGRGRRAGAGELAVPVE
jgi:drug/metabolite transporter (DMT)-like permease